VYKTFYTKQTKETKNFVLHPQNHKATGPIRCLAHGNFRFGLFDLDTLLRRRLAGKTARSIPRIRPGEGS
jgi:hypothetical protein